MIGEPLPAWYRAHDPHQVRMTGHGPLPRIMEDRPENRPPYATPSCPDCGRYYNHADFCVRHPTVAAADTGDVTVSRDPVTIPVPPTVRRVLEALDLFSASRMAVSDFATLHAAIDSWRIAGKPGL